MTDPKTIKEKLKFFEGLKTVKNNGKTYIVLENRKDTEFAKEMGFKVSNGKNIIVEKSIAENKLNTYLKKNGVKTNVNFNSSREDSVSGKLSVDNVDKSKYKSIYAEIEEKEKAIKIEADKKAELEKMVTKPEEKKVVNPKQENKMEVENIGTYPENGSKDDKFWYVYKKAKSLGDKFPEVTAAQYMLESGGGKSMPKESNNPFGQTTLKKNSTPAFKDEEGRQYYWKQYSSIDSAIGDRVKNWGEKYKEANDPISAMAMIQPKYAPNKHGNAGYMKAIATYLKQYQFFDGDINIPNADVKPEFYGEGRGFNKSKRYAYDQKSIDKNYKEYNKRLNDINKRRGTDNDLLLDKEAYDLQEEFQRKGLIPHFNAEIQKENELKKPLVEKSKKTLEDLENVLGKINIKYKIEKGPDGKEKQVLERTTLSGSYKSGAVRADLTYIGGLEEDEVKLLKTKYPKLFDKHYKNQYVNLSELNRLYNENYKTITGEDINLFDEDAKGNLVRNENSRIDIDKMSANNLGTLAKNMFQTGNDKGDYFYGTIVPIPKSKTAKPAYKPTLELLILDDQEDPIVEPEVGPEEELSTSDPEKYTEEDIKKVTQFFKKKEEAEKKADHLSTVQKMFDSEIDVPTPYKQEEFKDNFPYADVLAGIAGSVVGMEMAKEKVPLRDEQVSSALRNYASEMKKLSEIGLRPEDEAYAKQNLAESYQSNLNMITNASGGNRNLVLGNLSSVENQKQDGLLKLGLAESAAKNEALFKYGEAMKYINEFDANRDIANNERKYQQTMLNKKAGSELMSASFESILENIQLAKENAPGSINQIMKSHYQREWFGIDSAIKDNGKGDTEFTMSHKIKKTAEEVEKAKLFNTSMKQFNSLDLEGQTKVSEFIGQNRNIKNAYDLIGFMSQNDLKGQKMNLSNMSKAVNENNYSYLFPDFQPPKPLVDENSIMEETRIAKEGQKNEDDILKQMAEQYNFPIGN